MRKARIFKSGNSQALRLPKELRFRVDEVKSCATDKKLSRESQNAI